MAEIGIIASIIQIAGVGFKLSLILNAAGAEIASAGLEIHSISKGITLFSLMLKQVGQTLQSNDSVHTPEAEDAAKYITHECQQIFEEIQHMLDSVQKVRKDGSYGPNTIQKVKWCFKKHKVTYLLAQLESLKLSLSVMLQILQLGRLMASSNKIEQPEVVASVKSEAIQQERAETQNVIIVRYWQMNKLDRLYDNAEREDQEDRQHEIEERNKERLNEDAPQLVLEAPPDYNTSLALTRLPNYSLGELDEVLHQIRKSPKDMVQVSDQVIDPLLNKWTNWQHMYEHKDKRESGGSSRYVPSVQNVYEEDEGVDRLRDIDFHNREESPRGYFIEGSTTDWRQPNSTAARKEASQLRKKFTGYQPSVSANSSEPEDELEMRVPKSRVARHHVVDSSSESSDSEFEKKPRHRRRSSGSPTHEKKMRFPDAGRVANTYGPQQSTFGGRYTGSPVTTPGTTPRTSISTPRLPERPNPIPVQQVALHHTVSAPIQTIHTGNAPNPYAPQSPYSPHGPPPPYPNPSNGQTHPPPPNRYMPPQPQHRMSLPPRPGSQDGTARSPSRISHSSSSKYRGPMSVKEEAAIKVKKDKALAKSATKGILGAGGIAMFLEALEGLDI